MHIYLGDLFMRDDKLLQKKLEIIKKQKEKLMLEEARILRILMQEKMKKSTS
ncbi:hypothetical protein K1720_08055 [Thermococcus argininiproducens]|uniref:Uncharacterized protein n=1 Tax=Thermococcus argininiproducens TaxID=2866384 RepID=A0A9E7M9A7_9EURY|nr:hypothetical protein [Thermococcus argininiproducens]USG99465.1 hypothetical protein K1720_08055 [Thermococcus argininiproducens]